MFESETDAPRFIPYIHIITSELNFSKMYISQCALNYNAEHIPYNYHSCLCPYVKYKSECNMKTALLSKLADLMRVKKIGILMCDSEISHWILTSL